MLDHSYEPVLILMFKNFPFIDFSFRFHQENLKILLINHFHILKTVKLEFH